jgi:hypothetical protein
MLQLINNLPPHVVGVHAFADVTEAEYTNTLIPLFDKLLQKSKRINFILVLETKIKNFAPGMWCGNIQLGLKYFFKWRKVAVVSDQKGMLGYSDLFKYFIPGKFRSFPLDQLDLAVQWVDER